MNLWAGTVRVIPATQQTWIDSLVTVTIRIDSAENVHAYSLRISYDPSLARCVGIQHLNYFPSGSSIYFSTIDSLNGVLGIDEAMLGLVAMSGSGDAVRFKFVGLQNGQMNLNFTTVDFRDTANSTLQIDSVGGEIVINSPTGVRSIHNLEKSVQLLQNYPNPFNSSTMFRAVLPVYSHALLTIVDIGGRIVRTIAIGPDATGIATGRWDGTDELGEPAASGFYFARIVTQTTVLYTKIMLLK